MASVVTALVSNKLIGAPVHDAPPKAAGFGAGDATISNPGVFISAESLTFPSAAAVCAAIVGGLKLFFGDAGNVWWVLGVCFVVGSIIILLGWPKRDHSKSLTPEERRTLAAYTVIGVLNIFLLFISVMGILSVSTQTVPGLPPT